MAEKKMAVHTGHRGRVKQEFLARGIEGWPDHKVLELLLFYANPRGDVNPLAHTLMDRFGSLDRVLDALPGELMQVSGLGEHSRTLLKLVPASLGRYLSQRANPGQTIHTTEVAGAVLSGHFAGARNEKVYLLCLDAKRKLIGVCFISEGNVHNSDVTIRRVAEECLALKASYCYLAHNHVSNVALPSEEDINSTDVVRSALEPLQVQLVDHLIFSDDDMVSVEESRARGWTRGFQMISPGFW